MKSITKAVRSFFTDFCANSTIHGIRYFAERRRHWSERFWWVVAFGLSVWLCGSSIRNIWMKWHESPVTMSFNENEMPISAIPFPTVTICPETKVSKDKLDVVAAFHAINENRPNLSDIEMTRMQALIHVCHFNFKKNVHFKQKFTNGSIFEIIRDIAPTLDDTLTDCEWQKEFYNCSKLFVPIITGAGICFSFNALNSRDIYSENMAPELMSVRSSPNVKHWNLETGYESDVCTDEYPFRIFNAKQGGALITYPQTFVKDIEFLCRGSVQGFKVILTSPGEVLRMTRQSFRVPLLEEAEILIKPKLITASEGLRGYTPKQRQCYYSQERKLRFFKYYTQNNCEWECLGNFTKRECGCVKFSMPRDKNTKICGAENLRCFRSADKRLYGEDIVIGLKDASAKSFREKCDCLPGCTTITYDAEVDRAKFNFEDTINSYKISSHKFDGIRPSSIFISFKEHTIVTLRRTEKYSMIDFLAICGGLLGLFLGVSALSIIEFIYYSTLRLFCTFKQFRTDKSIKFIKRRHISVISPNV